MLAILGITPHIDAMPVLYRASDFPRICDALIAHINNVKENF